MSDVTFDKLIPNRSFDPCSRGTQTYGVHLSIHSPNVINLLSKLIRKGINLLHGDDSMQSNSMLEKPLAH